MTRTQLFTCRRCGFCCQGESTVSLDHTDQAKMIKVLQISKEEALAKYWKVTGKEIQMETVDGHCIFYKDGCSVHEGRPWRCREWPLVQAIVLGKENLETIRSSCPGIHKDASYEDICEMIKKGGCLSAS